MFTVSYILITPLPWSVILNTVELLSSVVVFVSNVVAVTISPPLEVTASVLPSKSNLYPNCVLGCTVTGLIVWLNLNELPSCI